MKSLSEILESRKKFYEKTGKKAAAELRKIKVEGNLRTANGGHGPKYYYVTQKGDTAGKYLGKDQMPLARTLAQRDYLKKVVKLCDSWCAAISRFQDSAPDKLVQDIDVENPARREIIAPLVQTDEEYADAWRKEKFQGRYFQEGDPEYYTDRGERVRSKSEKIIADKLNALGIPYRYEFPVRMKMQNGRYVTYHPDFFILNKASRKEIILEHFGLMDNEEYRAQAFEKIRLYESNGWLCGVNFLFTQETAESGLDSRLLEEKLKAFLFD